MAWSPSLHLAPGTCCSVHLLHLPKPKWHSCCVTRTCPEPMTEWQAALYQLSEDTEPQRAMQRSEVPPESAAQPGSDPVWPICPPLVFAFHGCLATMSCLSLR